MNIRTKIVTAVFGALGVTGALGASWAMAQAADDPATTTPPAAEAPADTTPATPPAPGQPPMRGRGFGGPAGERCEDPATGGPGTTPASPGTATAPAPTTPTTDL